MKSLMRHGQGIVAGDNCRREHIPRYMSTCRVWIRAGPHFGVKHEQTRLSGGHARYFHQGADSLDPEGPCCLTKYVQIAVDAFQRL